MILYNIKDVALSLYSPRAANLVSTLFGHVREPQCILLNWWRSETWDVLLKEGDVLLCAGSSGHPTSEGTGLLLHTSRNARSGVAGY